MTESVRISHPQVTNNSGQVGKVVESTIASTTTLQSDAFSVTRLQRVGEGGKKTLAERVSEAYKHPLELEEKELLDYAAEQFGQRLDSKG